MDPLLPPSLLETMPLRAQKKSYFPPLQFSSFPSPSFLLPPTPHPLISPPSYPDVRLPIDLLFYRFNRTDKLFVRKWNGGGGGRLLHIPPPLSEWRAPCERKLSFFLPSIFLHPLPSKYSPPSYPVRLLIFFLDHVYFTTKIM